MKMMNNDIVLFETKDKVIKLSVSVDNDTVWLSANQMALLFDRDEKTIRKHINRDLRRKQNMHFSFCPHCGTKLIEKEIGDEGIIPYCENCSVPLWDMFTTSIIAAVVNEYGEVALLRQNYVSETKYVCVAGIMKLGESAEDTVVREVKEEIGQDVEKLEFVRSYPYEKREMLMLGYKAIVKKKEFRLSREVDSAEWIKFEKALSLLREGSIGGQLVKTIIGQ